MITPQSAQALALHKRVRALDGLVALWDFREPAGQGRASHNGRFVLRERGKSLGESAVVQRVEGGPLSGYAARFTGHEFLRLPFAETAELNVGCTTGKVTVVAWIKRADKSGFMNARGYLENSAEFIAGIWREYDDTRSYGLYVNLPKYGGQDQVIGHVSDTGGPTPGCPYSRDYSASQSKVPLGRWVAIAFSYDGAWVRSYIEGECEERPVYTDEQGATYAKNPYLFPAGLYDGRGTQGGADFTLGAVTWNAIIHNRFVGDMGGVAVFDRALSAPEVRSLSATEGVAPRTLPTLP